MLANRFILCLTSLIMSRWVGHLFLIESSVVQTQFQELYQDVAISKLTKFSFTWKGCVSSAAWRPPWSCQAAVLVTSTPFCWFLHMCVSFSVCLTSLSLMPNMDFLGNSERIVLYTLSDLIQATGFICSDGQQAAHVQSAEGGTLDLFLLQSPFLKILVKWMLQAFIKPCYVYCGDRHYFSLLSDRNVPKFFIFDFLQSSRCWAKQFDQF